MARGSLYETKHWLRRSWQRKLLTNKQVTILKPLIDELSPRLNAYLKSIDRRCQTSKRARDKTTNN
jgi:four helix bundle protein